MRRELSTGGASRRFVLLGQSRWLSPNAGRVFEPHCNGKNRQGPNLRGPARLGDSDPGRSWFPDYLHLLPVIRKFVSALETNHIRPSDWSRSAVASPCSPDRDRETEPLVCTTEHQI